MEDLIKGIGGEYTGNYTGPHWSDGKVQESVEWGDSNPQGELDYLSREHDSAYARFKDDKHREAADKIYHDKATKLAGKFPQLAGNLVLYGNHAGRQAGKLFKNAKTGAMFGGPLGALAGAIYTAGGNIVDNMSRINGTYLKKEMADIEKYNQSDPRKVTLKDKALNAKNLVSPSPSKPGKPESTTKSDLIEKQARRFQNYAALEKEAKQSINTKTIENIPFLGHKPQRLQKAYRKRKKINKIYITN